MGNIVGKDDGDDFKRDETLGTQIRKDMHNDDSKYDPKPKKENEVDGVAEKVTKKILRTRLPIWLIVAAIVLFSLFRFYVYLTEDKPVNLRPIVTNAREIKIQITMCNEKVDRLKLNVRDEEKKLENKFLNEEKVAKADVTILRKDCN